MYHTSHSLVQPTNTTLVYLWQVESQLRIMAKCEPGFKIYTDCVNAMQSVEELGRLTLDDACIEGNTSESVVRHGRQASGCQGQGGYQSSQRPHLVSATPSCPHLVGITHPCPHLVGIIHLCPHLVSATHPCMTTPWKRQVRQQMRCVWILVMTWAPWHMMMQVLPIHLPMGTHLSPRPHSLLHLYCPPPVHLPHYLRRCTR